MEMEFKEEVDTEDEAASPLSHLSLVCFCFICFVLFLFVQWFSPPSLVGNPPTTTKSSQEEGDDGWFGDEAMAGNAWDKEGEGSFDDCHKITKKEALPLVVEWYTTQPRSSS